MEVSHSVKMGPLEATETLKEAVTLPMPVPILPLPTSKLKKNEEQAQVQGQVKRSPRLKKKLSQNKPTVRLAQEVLAMKWGIIEHDKALEELTLQQYLDIYRKPLTPGAMDAIKKLSQVAQKKKTKGKKLSAKTKKTTATTK